MKLHVIQETATPHNNVLLTALNARRDVDLELWYCEPKAGKYGWKNDLTHVVKPANLYAPDRIDWSFIRRILANPQEKILLVGWSNPSTRMLFILLCLLQRRFGMWFDLPQDSAPRSLPKKILRELFYQLLKFSRATIFAVGKMAVDYFKARGFAAKRLVNLPILVEVDHDHTDFAHQRDAIRARYGVKKGDILISGGSRLIYDKGFDLPITAIAALPKKIRGQVKLVIVGQGEELDNLKQLAQQHKILDQIHFPGWLAYEEFQALMAASEAFIHPARFDAWGSTIFAHALGVPVIGSTGAGSAYDRVQHGKNGWLFNPEKTDELTDIITTLMGTKPADLKKMGAAARKTAEAWLPATGAQTVVETLK